MNRYYALEKKNKFFSTFHKEFGGCDEKKPSVIVITNDLSSKIPDLEHFCADLWEFYREKGIAIEFLPLNRVMKPNNLKLLKVSEKIILSMYTDTMKTFLSLLKTIVSDEKIMVCYGEEYPSKDNEGLIKRDDALEYIKNE